MKSKIFIAFLFFTVSLQAQKVEWTSSTKENPWQKGSGIQKVEKQAGTPADIEIGDTKAQYIDGFGGCFNEMGWDALASLPQQEKEQVIYNLFSREQSNYTYCRMPVGASDYGLGFYSLNDVADDYKMVNFNIHRDRYILIPYIQAARKLQPEMKLFASPWSPPAWMKSNNHYASNQYKDGKDYNGMTTEKILEASTTAFRMERGILNAYALYFTKFVQAYEKEGIKIDAIHVQNEPCSPQIFPSCNWRAQDLTFFIGEFLGPKFEEEKIASDIYFGTINTRDVNYTKTCLENRKASKYVKGVGFQWDGKGAIQQIHREYPHLKMIQTESECGNGANDWNAAEYTWGLINHYMKNGANAYTYWNMILDETGSSMWGWVQNSLVSIHKTTGTVTYNPEYYLMKHVSHYVHPGAYLLESSGGDDHLAFVNPDGKIIVILVNKKDTPQTVRVGVKNQLYALEMKAHSFNTLTF